MKKIIFFFFIVSLFNSVTSQTKNLGNPLSYSSKINLSKAGYKLPEIDNQKELDYYTEISKLSGEKLMQYGTPHAATINVFEQAQKTELENGINLYQFMIESSSAISLNLIFDEFKLEKGTLLYIFSADKSSFIGAYTSSNNNSENILGTELLYSNRIIVEIQEPKQNENKSKLTIGNIIHGFINLDNFIEKSLNSSGNCNIDVNCPQGNVWEIPRNGVAMLVNASGGFCSGSLVNNTSGVLIPYFLTANHCGNTPGSWVFRFKWESPQGQIDCFSTGTSGNGPETMNINGGTTRASYAASDFHLIELSSAPDPNWGINYNGWDKSDVVPNSGACIHHPSGDIKKISISSSAFESYIFSGGIENHWKVYWSEGVTEGGSSGSPLFDQNRRIVGQLHGGASGCTSTTQTDQFGKFSYSWDGGGSPSTRLKDWLDPGNTGVDFIDADVTNNLDPFLFNKVMGLEQTLCTNLAEPKIIIVNGGSSILTSATIEYNVNGTNYSFPWTGNLGLYQSDTITLPSISLSSGNYTFQATVLDPNSSIDENMNNNTITKSFITIAGETNYVLSLNLDCFASETSWEIVDQNNLTLFHSTTYQNQDNPFTVTHNFCLADGCYDFNIRDSWGDGLSSTTCAAGSYAVTNPNNDTIVELLESEADFGNLNVKNFCIGQNNLNEYTENSSIAIYPNPTNSVINLKSIEEIEKIELVDLTGKKIFVKQNINSKAYTIDTEINCGIYLLQVKTSTKTSLHKIIKN